MKSAPICDRAGREGASRADLGRAIVACVRGCRGEPIRLARLPGYASIVIVSPVTPCQPTDTTVIAIIDAHQLAADARTHLTHEPA